MYKIGILEFYKLDQNSQAFKMIGPNISKVYKFNKLKV